MRCRKRRSPCGGGWRRLLLNGGEDCVRVLADEGANEKKEALGMGGAGNEEKRFWLESFHGCKLDEDGNNKTKFLERILCKDCVKGEVWGNVVEVGGL